MIYNISLWIFLELSFFAAFVFDHQSHSSLCSFFINQEQLKIQLRLSELIILLLLILSLDMPQINFQAIFSQIWRYKFVWTIILFALILCVTDENSLLNRKEIRAKNDALREEIAQYEEQFELAQKELRALQNDPDVVEEVARMRLFMKTPNEDVYVIE